MKLKDFNSNKDRGTNDTTKKEIKDIPLSEIHTYSNVRKQLKNIDKLAKSIKEVGLIDPITVFRHENKYWIFVGHRRCEAFDRLSKENADKYYKIPCIIKTNVNIETLKEAQLVENIQRESLSVEELQEAFEFFKKEKNMTNADIAKRLGVSESYVKHISSTLKTIESNPELAELVKSADDLTISDIYEIKSLPPKYQIELIKRRITREIKSIKQLREEANEMKEELNLKRSAKKQKNQTSELITFKPNNKIKLNSRFIYLDNLNTEEICKMYEQLMQFVKILRKKRKSNVSNGGNYADNE